jgi:hypothetical protein
MSRGKIRLNPDAVHTLYPAFVFAKTLIPRFNPLGKTGYVPERKIAPVVKDNPAGKTSADLPPLPGMKQYALSFHPFLVRGKCHLKPFIVTGESPHLKPVDRRDVKRYLIKLVNHSVKKNAFSVPQPESAEP